MFLVDSSIWIAYYRPGVVKKIEDLIKEIILADLVTINGIVITEVLSGISKRKEYNMVLNDFRGFHYLEMTEDIFFDASLLGSSLRKKGISIPPADLIIASSAIKHRCTIYHMDSHFDTISKNTKLEVKNLLKNERP